MTKLKRRKNQNLESKKESESKFNKKNKKKSKSSERTSLLSQYRNGGEGFIKWAEENIRVPIYPVGSEVPRWTLLGEMPDEVIEETGRSYKDLWEYEKQEIRNALVMENGKFKHNLIVFCWMRGEGKSLLACLIQLWKFFCFPKQSIMLGANSKDQVKFVHYDIMTDIIRHSPNLFKIVGEKNIQEKEIRLRDKKNRIVSIIRSISSFSGIVSNITGFTFSEIFDMKNPKFYSQLYGSIRNIPNALGVIDSTVSEKTHILYQLYQSYKQGKSTKVYFSYRSSKGPSFEDFWNPYMTNAQLENYRDTLPPDEYDRYFKNTWEVGDTNLISEAMVMATHYVGYQGSIVFDKSIIDKTQEIINIDQKIEDYYESNRIFNVSRQEVAFKNMKNNKEKKKQDLWSIEDFVTLQSSGGISKIATSKELRNLSELYRTDWCILTALDRADPLKGIYSKARTIGGAVAKGLPGSWDNQIAYLSNQNKIPKYIYVVIALEHIVNSTLDDIKSFFKEVILEYNNIDSFCSERWGVWDMVSWLEEEDVTKEIIQPTYERQRAMFNELYMTYKHGRLKTPKTGVTGSRMNDILEEEALVFKHNPSKKWYGSPEKSDRHGVQDDAIMTLALAIYGGRNLSYLDFREIQQSTYFGEMKSNARELYGSY